MNKLRVFLSDSQPVYREGLKSVLRNEATLSLVGEAEDGDTTVREAMRLNADVVVIDVSLPEIDGAEAVQRLREHAPESRILALSTLEDTDFARQMLERGVAGFVCKRAMAQVLIDAIHAVAEGRVYIDPAIGARMVLMHVRNGRNGSRPELSERELEAMRLLSYGYSHKEIAAQLKVSVKTVETYKARSMKKLGLDSRVDVVRYALKQGWLQGLSVSCDPRRSRAARALS